MIIGILLFTLVLSFILHMYFLIQYVVQKDKRFLRKFGITLVTNIILAMVMIILTFTKPLLIAELNVKILFWGISGLFMFVMFFLQFSVFRNIYKRAQMPEHYHLNFFGKKVLHPTVITLLEFIGFMGSIPFLLFSGAYFIARLINYHLYGHL